MRLWLGGVGGNIAAMMRGGCRCMGSGMVGSERACLGCRGSSVWVGSCGDEGMGMICFSKHGLV